jgi:choloylglycine hydrolase
VRAAVYSATAVSSHSAEEGIKQVFHILNNFDIPIGVAAERHDGQLGYDYTMFTVARDPHNLRYYWKTYDDQTIRMIDLRALGLGDASLAIGGPPKVKIMSTTTTQPMVDMSGHLASQK